ncbi:RDD family protein [Streptomyces sp. TRM68367]|uniref:RDD family protein n=1 Tax=Streptomyces sp. TRM68367 TaxID=2758415 RepID=UPI00165CAA15|nr:RDD family protein [Streptomyces sp. TRM68367]MBC9725544.1 RDD family protein [Streptomyces sp. TRM68367]
MSAPTPAPGDDRPREGYYPDPSIPGYVRYWNGAAWVPGTSRPAPQDGEPLAPPPGAGPAQPSVEETGPHFFDEDPVDEPASAPPSQHGSRPEPASAWGADRSQQSGFGDDQDRRVSWGAAAQGADPRVPHASRPADGPSQPDGDSSHADGTATIPPADSPEADNTFVFRRPTGGAGGAGGSGAAGGGTASGAARSADPSVSHGTSGSGAGGSAGAGAPGSPVSGGPGGAGVPGGRTSGGPGGAGVPGARASGGPAGAAAPGVPASGGPAAAPGVPASRVPAADEGTMAFRAISPRKGPQGQNAGASGASGTPGFGAGKDAAARAAAQPGGGQAATAPATPTAPSGPQQASPTVPPQPGSQSGAPQPAASAPAAPGPAAPPAVSGAPLTSGPGGGQSSWAQQVHRLAGAGDGQPVAPWKPPVEDVFQAAARQQAAARPAALGKRLAARLLDTVVVAGLTAVAAVPLGTKALDHVSDKIDAAKLSGETVTVWLLDGTTSVYLGIILAVLLLAGGVYEVLPTAKWGRTLGKKLLGLDVRDIEGHEPPALGAALRRWLVYTVPGLLVVGVIGVLWCLIDRPWRQCWHDKAAHTFVAG